MRRVQPEEVAKWKEQYEEKGMSIPAIARMAKRNHHVIYYHLLRAGTNIRSGQVGAEVTLQESTQWMSFYLAGQAPEDFAGNRTIQTIYKHLSIRLRAELLRLKGGELE